MTCKHDLIQTFRLETGEPVMWACQQCRAKFVPMQQLMDEVAAEREECAKVCDNTRDDEYTPGTNVECAAAIRSRK